MRVSGPTIKSRAQAEQVLGEVRNLRLDHTALAIELEGARKELDDRFGADMQALLEGIDERNERLMVWAESNEEEFGKNRSLMMVHGEIGWRKDPPTLVKKVRTAWKKMVDIIKEKLGEQYVRNNPDVDKEKIKAAYKAGLLSEAQLKAASLSVEQEDRFFVEPRIEDSDVRVAVEKRRVA